MTLVKKTKNKQLIVKKNKNLINLDYKNIIVEMTNNIKFKTKSTVFSNILKLDIDPTNHPAWTKKLNYVNTKANEIFKFNSKFKGLDF